MERSSASCWRSLAPPFARASKTFFTNSSRVGFLRKSLSNIPTRSSGASKSKARQTARLICRSLLHRFPQPRQVVFWSPKDRQRDELRHFVTVQLFYFLFQLRQTLLCRFNHQQVFPGLLEIPFPCIKRLDRAQDNIDARRQALGNRTARDPPAFRQRSE